MLIQTAMGERQRQTDRGMDRQTDKGRDRWGGEVVDGCSVSKDVAAATCVDVDCLSVLKHLEFQMNASLWHCKWPSLYGLDLTL